MTVNETEEKTLNTEIEAEIEEESYHALAYDQLRAAALAYARILEDIDSAQDEETPAESEAVESETEEASAIKTTEEISEEEVSEIEIPEEASDEEAPEEAPAEEAPEEAPAEEAPEEAPTEDASEEAPAEEAPEEAPAEEAPAEATKEAEKPGPKKTGKNKKVKAKKAKDLKKIKKREKAKARNKEKFLKGGNNPFASVTNLHDKVQDGIDGTFNKLGKDVIKGAHRISSSYKNSRRVIGTAILITGLVAAGILIVFDYFTVYEYAYNGKVLGYVSNQEEVTDILDIAGRQLTQNNSTEGDVKFVANQNVTFNPVDRRGKSTDDSDTVVNKLIYMTDIETEAYAVYDGDRVVAIVKDQNDADSLLLQTKADLSVTDRGMELVSSEFTNELSVKPVNVLLGSVQSNAAAQKQMVSGGKMNTYHIVEEGETVESLASEFGVEVFDIYDEENRDPVSEIEQGDRVCIRSNVTPVSVKMVEKGKFKEVIEYQTIKKETDEYYKGDAIVEQEGQDGVQIFEGIITKIGGEVTERKETAEPEILKKKKDKIILVGTAERPKTAATGTFIVPLDHYTITSEWGGRWGRMHEGMDLAAPTGTPIHASDGGRVIKANFWSGHGLCVEIDHGNGVITRYSHCSATLVSIGDLVYQGQHIANVGNTGHSFGSHCHFEVRVNGVSQNPRNYISP